MIGVQHATPSPQRVRHNDWRWVEVAAPGSFTPELPASVVVPYHAQPEELGRAMVAALRGERPSEQALRACAADFSVEKAVDAYVALFDKPATGRAR